MGSGVLGENDMRLESTGDQREWVSVRDSDKILSIIASKIMQSPS